MNIPSLDRLILKTHKPENPAIFSSSEQLTFLQLNKETNSLSYYFFNAGIRHSDLIAVVCSSSIQIIKIIISLWKINAVPVILSTRLAETEIINQIKFTRCKKVIIDDAFQIIKNKFESITIHNPGKLKNNDTVSAELNKDDTALIIFTSGSSGNPKAVVHTFGSLFQSAEISNQVLNQSEESRWLASLPFYHIGGFSIITRSLLFGCSIVIPSSLKTGSLSEAFEKFSPTHCSLVPTQLKRLIESGIRPNIELKKILIGGGWIYNSLTEDAIKNNWSILKVYGSTESASLVAAIDAERIRSKLFSTGKILYPNKIKIVDEYGNSVAHNQHGEIVIKSSSLFKEYLYNDDETRKKLIDGWYFTGDIGWLDEEGYLFLESRRTDLIICGGENINPLEIEELLLSHPGIADAVVFPISDNEWGQIPAVAIVKKSRADFNSAILQEYLKGFLAGYKIPQKIFFEESLERNELDKLDRNFFVKKYQT